MSSAPLPCGSAAHFSRRTLLRAAGLGGSLWLTPLAERLALAAEAAPRGRPAQSVIVLWLEGGPSQLETFDPHPGTEIAAGSLAIKTSVPEIQLAAGFEQLAEQMEHVSLVRSLVSKEGDHERATYYVKNGWRPDPTVVHPSLGAIVCHQLQDEVQIPRHVSIYPGAWPARGGYLGDRLDAFKTYDPLQPVPDVLPRVDRDRMDRRLEDLTGVVEAEFARGRLKDLDKQRTLHLSSIEAARRMMSSDQRKAFEVASAPQSLRDEFGDSRFGRGCLAALQLIEVGVRAVEISLGTFDAHANNHDTHAARLKDLDPAFAALIRNLKARGLFESTVILCGGEFGRTPKLNGAGGRDHWPHGFSMALAGGGIRGGRVVGATNPQPRLDRREVRQDPTADVTDPRQVEDVHATVLRALGIVSEREIMTPIGRPLALGAGRPIEALL